MDDLARLLEESNGDLSVIAEAGGALLTVLAERLPDGFSLVMTPDPYGPSDKWVLTVKRNARVGIGTPGDPPVVRVAQYWSTVEQAGVVLRSAVRKVEP
jgi:hypothetical protein